MKRLGVVVVGLLALAAAGAAEDTVAFVRDGQAWWAPAGGNAVRLVDDDASWTYALPTWIDGRKLVVMRLRNGEAGRSMVGLLAAGGTTVKADAVRWLPDLAGAYSIGVNAARGQLSYLKVRRAGDGAEVFLGTAKLDGSGAASRSIGKLPVADVGPPDKRLRWSLDGRYAVVPAFPTDVSATAQVYDAHLKLFPTPFYTDARWLADHGAPPEVSAGAYGPGGRFVFGSLLNGVWEVDVQARTVHGIDIWATAQGTVHEVCWSSDARAVYYDVQPAADGSKPEIRICNTAAGARAHKVFDNACQPDVLLQVRR